MIEWGWVLTTKDGEELDVFSVYGHVDDFPEDWLDLFYYDQVRWLRFIDDDGRACWRCEYDSGDIWYQHDSFDDITDERMASLCTSLEELHLLLSLPDFEIEDMLLLSLPTFGGDPVDDGMEVYSWDPLRVLVLRDVPTIQTRLDFIYDGVHEGMEDHDLIGMVRALSAEKKFGDATLFAQLIRHPEQKSLVMQRIEKRVL